MLLLRLQIWFAEPLTDWVTRSYLKIITNPFQKKFNSNKVLHYIMYLSLLETNSKEFKIILVCIGVLTKNYYLFLAHLKNVTLTLAHRKVTSVSFNILCLLAINNCVKSLLQSTAFHNMFQISVFNVSWQKKPLKNKFSFFLPETKSHWTHDHVVKHLY